MLHPMDISESQYHSNIHTKHSTTTRVSSIRGVLTSSGEDIPFAQARNWRFMRRMRRQACAQIVSPITITASCMKYPYCHQSAISLGISSRIPGCFSASALLRLCYSSCAKVLGWEYPPGIRRAGVAIWVQMGIVWLALDALIWIPPPCFVFPACGVSIIVRNIGILLTPW